MHYFHTHMADSARAIRRLVSRFVKKTARIFTGVFKRDRYEHTLRYIERRFKIKANGPSPVEIPDTDRATLAQLFRELGFRKGAEIGVEEGVYAEILCKANPGLLLYGIDPWKAYEGYFEHRTQEKIDGFRRNAEERLKNCQVKFINKMSMDAAKDFEDGSLDFVYIDGNHRYDFALQDITEWTKKVRPGGIVSGHDYRRDKSGMIQVVEALNAYASARKILFFVFGRKDPLPGEKRDKHRSWMFVKSVQSSTDGPTSAISKVPVAEKISAGSMLGKWNSWYKGVKEAGPFRYGNTVTYQLAADFMSNIKEVEDWGCGTGGFRRFYKGKYVGLDGSANPFVDKVVDLRTYRSNADGIVMRHVLEHNYDWDKVLAGAVASFRRKLCLVLFTPFQETTKEIAHNKKHGVDVPDMAFARKDIEDHFKGLKWRMESRKTRTGYGIEHIYYVEKAA